MSDTDFDLRVERVKKAAEVIGSLPSKALQADAFRYLLGETPAAPAQPKSSVTPPTASAKADSAAGEKKSHRSPSKAPITQDRNVELFPKDKTSFKDFAVTKIPTNNNERYSVAVYWLREIAEYGTATVAQVVSCFRAAGWALPKDVANAASQAVNAGYLSSGKSDDLKLSSIGINLVDNDLPRTKA